MKYALTKHVQGSRYIFYAGRGQAFSEDPKEAVLLDTREEARLLAEAFDSDITPDDLNSSGAYVETVYNEVLWRETVPIRRPPW